MLFRSLPRLIPGICIALRIKQNNVLNIPVSLPRKILRITLNPRYLISEIAPPKNLIHHHLHPLHRHHLSEGDRLLLPDRFRGFLDLEYQTRHLRDQATRTGEQVLADHAMRIQLAARGRQPDRVRLAIDRLEHALEGGPTSSRATKTSRYPRPYAEEAP